MENKSVEFQLLNNLLEKADNRYLYHSSILKNLKYAIINNVEKVRIFTSTNGERKFHLWLTKEDWPLAISMCERFYSNTPQSDVNTINLKVISELKDKIR